MDQAVFYGILIPFLGTSLGAACVFFMKHDMSERLSRILTGFAAGVMVAASIWSLLIPAIEQSEGMGKLSFLPAFIGFWVGRDGKVCVYSSSSWILGWHSVSASVRSHHPTFAQVQCQRRGTKEQIAETYHDGAGRHAA